MNDPIKSRPAGEPRLSIDLDDIERRLRESLEPVPVPPPAFETAPAKPAALSHDPLAELARLVGGAQDPFSKVFAPAPGLSAPPRAARQMPPLDPPPVSMQPAYAASYAPQTSYAPVVEAVPAYGDYQQPAYGAAHDHQQASMPHEQADWSSEPQAYADHQAYADQYEDVDQTPRRQGRAKLLIAAAVVIAVGGLAAALTLRGGSSFGEAPTIMASSGPVKVQPAQPVEDTSKPNISVLERGANTQRDSKVVQSEEQPVDLGTAARSAGQRPVRTGEAGAPVTLAPPPPPPVANSLFAEPKKVKAVAVRPDGTIIDPNAPAAPVAATKVADKPAAPVNAPAAPAAKPNDLAALVAASTASAEPPKAAARATDAKPAPAAPSVPVPPQRMATGAPMDIVAAPPAPAPAAPAAQIATANATSGTYAVQLVGTTSSDEAKAALDRVNTKFRTELGSYRPTVVKAEDAGRTVYRVRVINLSNDDATRLCTKLKASGGTCFVARS